MTTKLGWAGLSERGRSGTSNKMALATIQTQRLYMEETLQTLLCCSPHYHKKLQTVLSAESS
jgi:hypothetical protein